MSFDDKLLVPEAKSPLSMRATRRPRSDCVEGDAGAGDAAAENEQIKGLFRQPCGLAYHAAIVRWCRTTVYFFP